MKKLIFALFMAALITGCSAKKGAKVHADYTVLKQETYGGRDTESGLLVNTAEELKALYNELNLADTPKVDFTKHSIVAVFMGQKRTGGYSIAVTGVDINDGVATVSTSKSSPSGGMVTMALSAPYSIIEIPKVTSLVVK